MSQHASLTLEAPNGSKVLLLGVSHTSAIYGPLARSLIEEHRPSAVVLEIDEVRKLGVPVQLPRC
jgi:pheromone shutdown protein TraB